jgi:lipid-A-disaccharide synthase
VLIDYPGFNLRFARIAKKFGVTVVYYISPQVWAWHRSRVKKMRGVIDKMLVIFPFEVKFYHDEGIEAEFVGHPLLESLSVTLDRPAFVKRYGLDPEKKILGVLPGSRRQEIEEIFPPMLEGAKILARDRGMEVAVAVAPTLEEQYFRTMYNVAGVHLVKGATYEVMQYADFAFVTSGTATLETALFQTPMFVVYKTSWLTYLIGRALVQVSSIGLVNIVAGKKIVPEFIQHAVNGPRLAREAAALLDDPTRLAAMKTELAELRRHLGTSGASGRVAEAILAVGRPTT